MALNCSRRESDLRRAMMHSLRGRGGGGEGGRERGREGEEEGRKERRMEAYSLGVEDGWLRGELQSWGCASNQDVFEPGWPSV